MDGRCHNIHDQTLELVLRGDSMVGNQSNRDEQIRPRGVVFRRIGGTASIKEVSIACRR